jgi:hypothetical protein
MTVSRRVGRRQGLQLDDVRSPGQGLRHSLHERELLRAGEQVLACAVAVGIDDCLEVPEQRRRILHLIDDGRSRMAAEESRRLLLRLLGLGGQVEGNEGMTRKQPPQGRGLAGLAGPGQHHDGAGSGRAPQPGFDVARNPHALNIRLGRIFCKGPTSLSAVKPCARLCE